MLKVRDFCTLFGTWENYFQFFVLFWSGLINCHLFPFSLLLIYFCCVSDNACWTNQWQDRQTIWQTELASLKWLENCCCSFVSVLNSRIIKIIFLLKSKGCFYFYFFIFFFWGGGGVKCFFRHPFSYLMLVLHEYHVLRGFKFWKFIRKYPRHASWHQ